MSNDSKGAFGCLAGTCHQYETDLIPELLVYACEPFLLLDNLPLRIRTSHPAHTAELAALIMAEQAEVTPPELKFRCEQACWRAVASASAQSSAGQRSSGLPHVFLCSQFN